MDTREAVARIIEPGAFRAKDKGRDSITGPERRRTALRKADAAIAAHLKALAAEGYVVVPREPTEAMLQTGCNKHTPGVPMDDDSGRECPRIANRRTIYRAMIQEVDNG